MSSSFDDIIKQGYLRVKGRGSRIGTWNKRWFILRKSSSKGPARLEKYADEETSFTVNAARKTILLKDAQSVSKLPADVKKHAFAIIFHDGSSKQLAAESDHELNLWFDGCKRQFDRSTAQQPGRPSTERRMPGPRVELYNVYLVPSSAFAGFGESLLQVTPEAIKLWDPDEPQKLLVQWPITSLRRYGKDTDHFTIEAGRRCDTGEGLFVFNTYEALEIYDEVHKASQSIATAQQLITANNFRNNNNPVTRTTSDPTNRNRVPPPLQPRPSDLSNGTTRPRRLTAPTETSEESFNYLPPAPDPPHGRPSLTSLPTPPQQTPPPLDNQLSLNGGQLGAAGGDDELPYIYEEKYLANDFRRYLHSRKEPEES